MATIDESGYVTRLIPGAGRRGESRKHVFRNWYFVKWSDSFRGQIRFGNVTIPKEFVGKRVRFKIEILQ